MSLADPDNVAIAKELVQRILFLRSAVDQHVIDGKYEVAARLRDEREAAEIKLKSIASPTLIRNVDLLSGQPSV